MTQERRRSPVTALLATDRQRSTLYHQARDNGSAFSYSAFGHDPVDNGKVSLLGFTGEPRTNQGYYLLGRGYRCYNSTLMRFNSPDSYSPFGSGGLNAYIFCEGDPINYTDPTGHMRRSSSTSSLPSYDAPPSFSVATRPRNPIPSASSVFEQPPGYYAPYAPPQNPYDPSAPAYDQYEPSAPPITNDISLAPSTVTAPTTQRPSLSMKQLKKEQSYKKTIDKNTAKQKELKKNIRKTQNYINHHTLGSYESRNGTRQLNDLIQQHEQLSESTRILHQKIDNLRQGQ
ncbi:RHS repeat-associated core domain-containing protein [Pseudomonas sp. CAM1A]|uniref:RHS repeat-associated core domain-containing protein n=1 Tax=Pseudomonas sp. CAM1A TaxID=3231717 RepID=UPI0039C6E96E